MTAPSSELFAAIETANPDILRFDARVFVSRRQPEAAIREQVASSLREVAAAVESGVYATPERDEQ
jgi:hypothetical protein